VFQPGFNQIAKEASRNIGMRSARRNFVSTTIPKMYISSTNAIRNYTREYDQDMYKASLIEVEHSLMKRAALGDIDAVNMLIGPNNIYAQGMKDGFIDPDVAAKNVVDAKGRIANIQANELVRQALNSGNPSAIRGAANQIAAGAFPDLTPERADVLLRRLDSGENTAINRGIAAANRRDRQEKADRKDLQTAVTADFMLRVERHRLDPQNNPLPTVEETVTAFSRNELTLTQLEKINGAIRGNDAPTTNTERFLELQVRIDEALDDRERRILRDEIIAETGPGGSLSLGDASNLLTRNDQAATQTPQYRREKEFRNYLQGVTGASPETLSISGISADEMAARERANDAMIQYDTLVRSGVDPQDAYERTADAYRRSYIDGMNRLGPSADAVPPSLRDKDISQYTKEDFDSINEYIVSNRNLTQVEKEIEFESLRDLAKYLKNQKPVIKPGEITETENPPGTFERIINGVESIFAPDPGSQFRERKD
jgi:hypothetical protein